MADGDVLSITISDDTAAGGSNGAGFGGVIVVDNTGGTYSASATTSTTGIKLYRNLPSVRKWYDDDTHWQPIKSFATPVVNGSTLEVPFDVYVPIDSDLTVKVDAPAAWLTEGGSDAAAISMVTATNNSTRTIDRRYATMRAHNYKGNKYVNVTALDTSGGLNFKATTVVERQQIRVDVRNFSATGGSAWRDVEYRWTFEESNTGSPTLGNDAHWDAISWGMEYEDKATGATLNQATDQIGPMAALDILSDGGAGNQIRVTCTPITHNAGTYTTQSVVQAAVTITPLTDTTRRWFSSGGDNANDGRDFLGLDTLFNYTASTKKLAAISGTPFSGVSLSGDFRDDVYLTPIPNGQSTAEVYLDTVQDAFSTGTLPNLGVGVDFTLTGGSLVEQDGVDCIRDPRGTISATSATAALTVILLARTNNNGNVFLEGHDSSNNPAWRLRAPFGPTFTNKDSFAVWDTLGTQYKADWSTNSVANTSLRAFVGRYSGSSIDTRYDAGTETDSALTANALRTADNITIGSQGDGGNATSLGDFHFVGVWNSYLSTDTIELIEAILYGRTGRALPAGHTYEGVSIDAAYRRLAAVDSSALATLEAGWTVDVEVKAASGSDLDTSAISEFTDNLGQFVVGDIEDLNAKLSSLGSLAEGAMDRRRIMGIGNAPPTLTATTTLALSERLASTSPDRTNEVIEFLNVNANGQQAYIRFDDVSSVSTVDNTGIRDINFYNTSNNTSELRAGSFISRVSWDCTGQTVSTRTQLQNGYKEYATITDLNLAGHANEGVLAHGLYPFRADAHQFRGLYFDELHDGANFCLNWDAGDDTVKNPSPYKILSNSRIGNSKNGFDLSAQQNTRHEDGGDDNPHQFVIVEDNVIGPCSQGYGTLYYVCDDATIRRCVFYGCKTAAIRNEDTAGTLYAYDNDIFLSSSDGQIGVQISKSANDKPHQIHGNRIRIDSTAPRALSCSFTAMAASVTAGATFSDNLVYVPNDTSGGKIIYDLETSTAKTVAEFEAAVGLTGGTSFTIVNSEAELGWEDSANLLFEAAAVKRLRARTADERGAVTKGAR